MDVHTHKPATKAPRRFSSKASLALLPSMLPAAKDVWLARIKNLQATGHITPRCAWIAYILVWWRHEGGACFPSHKEIARKASARMPVSTTTVQRALKRLRDLGFLSWTAEYVRRPAEGFLGGSRTERTSNSYRFYAPDLPHLLLPTTLAKRLADEARIMREYRRRANGTPLATDGHSDRRDSIQKDIKINDEQRAARAELSRKAAERAAKRHETYVKSRIAAANGWIIGME